MALFQILLSTSQGGSYQPISFRTSPLSGSHWGWARYGSSTDTSEFSSFDEAQAALNLIHATGSYREYAWRIAVVGGDYPDVDWRTREKIRFADGTYAETPWHNEPWYQAKHNDLFVHMSVKKDGSVSFTENEAKGAADRQSPAMRPGRFLNRFFSDVLSNEDIEGWCAKVSFAFAENELRVTQNADEIEAVYLGGPNSCMSKDAGYYSSTSHPTRVYAGPDLGIAYIGSMDDAKARCVVWPERKLYGQIYGDVSRLRLILEDAGYTRGDMDGARIRRIEDRGQFVVPYIDGADNVSDEGDFLVIDDGGYITASNTSGLAPMAECCPDCGDRVDSLHPVEGWDHEVCDDCRSAAASYCEHSGLYYPDDGEWAVVTVEVRYGTRAVSLRFEDAFNGGFVRPDGRDDYMLRSLCFECDDCGEWFHQDDRHEYNGEALCGGCHDAIELIDDTDEDQQNAHVLARTAEMLERARLEREREQAISRINDALAAKLVRAGAYLHLDNLTYRPPPHRDRRQPSLHHILRRAPCPEAITAAGLACWRYYRGLAPTIARPSAASTRRSSTPSPE